MKILQLCTYSAGVCGVWQRVKQDTELLLNEGHEVKIFSSSFVKGSDEIAPEKDTFEKAEIKRFPATRLGGESFMSWDFSADAKSFNPDIIIAHSFRHSHTTKASKLAKALGARVFLVTHAPFLHDEKKPLLSRVAVKVYDSLIAPSLFRRLTGVLIIAPWEREFLKKFPLPEEKIHLVPNSIAASYFSKTPLKKRENVVFLGRISPVKNIETLLRAWKKIQKENPEQKLLLVGPEEEEYGKNLRRLIKEEGIEDSVVWKGAVHDSLEKRKIYNSARVFVLPSHNEGMPISLLEAMASGCVCIGSQTKGIASIITERKTGFLFPPLEEETLAKKVLFALDKKNDKNLQQITHAAKDEVHQFREDRVFEKLKSILFQKQ